GTVNQSRSAHHAPTAGASRSRIEKDRTIVLFWTAAGRREGMASLPGGRGGGGGVGGGGQQRLGGGGGAVGGAGVAEQAAGVVVGQHGPVQVVGELLGVGVGPEVPLGDAPPEHL